jgi:hypothetical protein
MGIPIRGPGLLALLFYALPAHAAESAALRHETRFSGMADASAGVAVSSNLFLVADDEDNRIRLYNNQTNGGPLKEFPLDEFLEVDEEGPEADLEGCARIGDRIFWIGSHGRSKDGKKRPNRQRLFATDLAVTDDEVHLTPIGKPCRRLLADLIQDSRFAKYGFAQAAKLAPREPGALNIEGLCATPEGHLLIGFRNPIPKGKALLIPLLNPNRVIQGQPAQFGEAIELDLRGLGIRDIALFRNRYLLIAGVAGEQAEFKIYRWGGQGSAPEALHVPDLQKYSPEAVVIYPERGLKQVQLLSDDGTVEIEGVRAKHLSDPAKKSFRAVWLEAD